MPRRKKHVEPDEQPGAPEWMVTFSDCMTLLLTFFVLLLTFSSFDEHIFQKLTTTFADFPSISATTREAREALSRSRQVESTTDVSEGSEKPTLEQGNRDGLKEETGPDDFRSKKVFLTASQEVFWGRGTYMSRQGKQMLAKLASLFEELPGRVVISENGPAYSGSDLLGLHRAWAVMEYFVARQGLDRGRFSISAASTVPEQNSEGGPHFAINRKMGAPGNEPRVGAERVLEIVLLERSIYN